MKYIKILSLALCTVVLTTGCDGFLKEVSQDEVIPSSADDLQQLLLGEGYQTYRQFMPYLDMLTDDVMNNYTESSNQQGYVEHGKSPFCWEVDMAERMKETGVGGNSWADYYSLIKGCNVVLDMIDGVTGSEATKSNVRGQALALRGYYYFMLANLYAKPYNAPGIDRTKELCVPLILTSTVRDEFPTRNTMDEVYTQIEKDLLEAMPLMETYGQRNIRDKVTDQFVHLFLCRLYLYQERWEESSRQADIVLEKQPELLQIANYASRDNSGFYRMHVYHPQSPELIWCYASSNDNFDFVGTVNGSDTPAFLISNDLKSLYQYNRNMKGRRGDMRALFYYNYYNVGSMQFDPITGTFQQATEMYWGNHCYNSGDAGKGFRTAEAYLNRAEAKLQLWLNGGNDNLREEALEDINTLRQSRWEGTYKPITLTDKQELWQFYKDERRREFAFDDHRWFDLRRWGMPRLVHIFTQTKNEPQEIVLEEGDLRYVLQIPQEVLDRNPQLKQNPRTFVVQ